MFPHEQKNIRRSLEESLLEESFKDVLIACCRSFNFSIYRLSILLIFFAVIFTVSPLNDVSIVRILSRSNTIVLALLAITFLSYLLFQNSLSKKNLILFHKYADDRTNQSVYNTTQRTILFTILNQIGLLFFGYIWLVLFDANILFPVSIKSILIAVYTTLISYWIIEMKSLAYNYYQLFKLASTNRIIKIATKNSIDE